MFQKTPTQSVLLKRSLTRFGLGLFTALIAGVFISLIPASKTSAAATTTVNFQARLETAAGAIVPDGNYNIEFKLYNASSSSGSSQGSCTGDSACLWTETRTSTNQVHVVNGYLSVALGSVNAFPSTINWNQNLWLTMNIGGTGGSPTWDGEMSPRIALAATPYSFQANQLANYVSGNQELLQFTGSPSGNVTLDLPDSSGTLCLQGSSSCGFVSTGGLSSSAFVQGGNSFGTATLLGTNDSNSLSFETNGLTQASIAVGGATLFKNSTNSTTAFQVQPASSSTSVLDVDTTHGEVGINTNSPGYALDVNGVINSNTSIDVGGVAVCTVSGCTAASGSGSYIQNSTSIQSPGNFAIRSTGTGSVTGVLQGASGQTADILDIQSWNGTSATTLASFGANGNVGIGTSGTPAALLSVGGTTGNFTVNSSGNITTSGTGTIQTTSTTAFQVQSAGGSTTVLNADTTNSRVQVDATFAAMGVPASPSATAVAGSGLTNGTTYYYKVTAIDSLGGETTPSTETSAAATSTGGKLAISLTWTASTGASGYHIYRSLSTGGGSGTETLYDTTLTNSYTDTNTGVGSGASLPGSNTAYTSTSTASTKGQLSVGGNGTPTGQLYVSGQVPSGVLGNISGGNNPEGVYVQDNYAYVVANTGNTLKIFDISNPADPILMSTTTTGTAPIAVYVQGHYAYVTNATSGTLQIFDVSNPASVPAAVGSISTGDTNPQDVWVQGRYAYVVHNGGSDTLRSFDISNPANPVFLSSVAISTGGRGLYIQGRYAYVTDPGNNKMSVFDISNPYSIPAALSNISVCGNSAANSIYVQGLYAYVPCHGSNAIYIYNVSNPASIPAAVGTLSTGASTAPNSISVQGRYAYFVNATSDTLQVADVSNPADPISLGTVSTGASVTPYSITIQGRYAYVVSNVNNGSGFETFDLGGTYSQQLQAGSTETGTLAVDTNASVNGDINIQGGASVGQSLQVYGAIGSNGAALFADNVNSTTAFQVQNTGGTNLLAVDTSGNNVYVGSTGSNALASTVNIATSSSSSNIQAVNIGSNSDTSNTITIDAGTGANSIAIGNSASAHNIAIGNASGANNVTVNIGTGTTGGSNTAAVTIGSANGAASTTLIQGGTGGTAIALSPNASGGIQIGVATETGTIVLGQSTAGNIINIGSANPSSATQTINIGNGAAATSGGEAVNIANGIPGSSTTNTVQIGTGGTTTGTVAVTIGSVGAAAHTTLIQGGNGSTAIALQTATSGTIVIGSQTASTNNTVTIGDAGSTTNTDNVSINNTSGTNTGTITLGGTGSASGTITIGQATTANNTVSIGSGNLTAATQTVSIGNGTSTTSGGEIINIGNGIPGSSTTNTVSIGTGGTTTGTVSVTIGSIGAAAHTTTIQGGNGSTALQLLVASGGTIGIANYANASSIDIANASGANNVTLAIGNGVTGGSNTATVTIGSNNAAGSVTSIQGGNGAGAIVLTPNGSGGILIGGTSEVGTIVLGHSTSANSVTIADGAIASGTQTVTIGNGATSSGIDSVTIGSTNSTSSTILQGGNGSTALQLQVASGGTIGIANNAVAQTVTIGNVTGATGITESVGTGNFSLDGVAGSTYAIGPSTTTGTITIGGTAQSTGLITLGDSTATNTVNVGSGSGATGATTVNISNNDTGGAVNIGTALTTGNISIGGAATSGNINIGAFGAETGTLYLGQSSATNTVVIGNGGGATSVYISNGNTAGNVNVGNAFSTGSVTIGGSSETGTLSLTSEGITQNITGSSSAPSDVIKTTTNSASAFQVQSSGATILNVDTTAATVTVATTASGGALVNNGATLNTALALSNFTSNTAIGTAAATVNVYTTFTIPQTTTSITLTIPSPTNTTAGRFIYILNTGSASFTIGSTIISGGTDASFVWNGTAWTSTAVSTGVSLIGTLDGGTANGNAATITGNTLYLQSASGSEPGIVNTTTQSFEGNKTFTGTVTVAPTSNTTTALQAQNASGVWVMDVDTTNGNLISNPGFNTGTTGWAATGTGASIAYNTTAANTYEGVGSLKLTTTNPNANTGTTVSSFTTGTINSTVSSTYYFSFYAMLSTGSMSTLGVTITGGGAPTCTINNATVLTTGFQRYSCSFAPNTSNVTAINIIDTSSAGHVLYIDAAELTTSSTMPTYDIGQIQLTGVVDTPTTFQSASNTTTALMVANASGSAVFTVDTINSQVVVGSGSNTLTLNTTSGLTATGSARHTKKIVLTAEYAGAVLSSSGCSSDIGTMTAGYDGTQKENYYQWTTAQSTNQCYNIVVQIPIPSDFSAWASNDPLTVDVNTTDTTNGTILGTLLDTSGTAVTNWNTCALTPTVTSTWVTSGAGATHGATCNITTGTWTAGGVATLTLQLQAPNAGITKVGDIVLTYLSAF